jgi:uncharacterized damage-inducible protein DinB
MSNQISQMLLPEFDRELATTRKTLERIPQDKLTWKPHEKSGTAGWLAAHIALLPSWGLTALTTESLDIAPPGAPPYRIEPVTDVAAMLATFDEVVKNARAALAAASDEDFSKPWSLLRAGHTMFTMPRFAVYRDMVMNHLIHHRAQLAVYLRLLDVPVPALYGPSADEDVRMASA